MNLKIDKITFQTVTLSAVTTYIGFYAWRILFNNFAVEVFDASPTAVGAIQAAREIPGLLAFGVGALAVYLTESRIASLAIVVLGLGLVLCGAAPSIVFLGAATVVLSLGFHYFYPANSSQLLLLAKQGEIGRTQGKYQSYESVAGLTGAALILLLTLVLDYRQIFYVIGGLVGAVGLYFTFALPANRGATEKRKVRIQKKYWLYYTLSFLRGCRRHIFTTFAIFLLVKNFDMSITVIASLMFVNNFLTIFTNRALGSLNDRFGERAILVSSSLLLVFVFLGYAYVELLPVLIGLYIVDNILYGSGLSVNTYIRKIATKEDLTGCLSFGMTANHIVAVIIPVVGGIAWEMFGYEVPFVAGAVIVALDMFFAFKVRTGPEVLTETAVTS